MRKVEIISEPKGDVFNNLIDLAFNTCNEFILVRRKDMEFNQNGEYLLELLKDSLKEVKEQSKWPGTQLLDTAKVYYYNTNESTKEILKNFSSSLYSWIQPNLLEDLCFFKNQEPWLVNIAHEKISYFITNEENEIDKILSVRDLKVKL